MKDLKNFVERHIYAIILFGSFALLIAGLFLNKLLIVLSFLLWFAYIPQFYYREWVCTKCGGKEILGRHKFCSKCGDIMHAVKKERILCSRGHRVEKHDTFCSKCGVRL